MLRKNIFFNLLIITAVSIFCTSVGHTQGKEAFRLNTVVIDAGHGGKDPGCVYGGVREKDIVLGVALKLSDKIRKYDPNIRVINTRGNDVFVELWDRGKIANQGKGNLFISLHVNAQAKGTTAKGAEVYTLGLHKSAQSLEVAQKENSVITLEDNYEVHYEGFDPNDAESYIMFGLGQYAHSRESIDFAYEVQKSLVRNCPFTDRGIRQAGYLVLWRTAMPSILIEMGFLSNPDDRKYLASAAGQEEIADAIFSAFVTYKKNVEVPNSYTPGASAGEKTAAGDTAATAADTPSEKQSLYFTVQVSSSASRVRINASTFGSHHTEVFEVKVGNSYKYCIGKSDSYKEALSLQQKLRKTAFRDAFVIAFENGKRVDVNSVKNR